MKHRIGIEPALSQVRDFLDEKGFEVETLNITSSSADKLLRQYDALVVTGLNSDVMGIQDTSTKSVIINAKGLTAEQVYRELESRL